MPRAWKTIKALTNSEENFIKNNNNNSRQHHEEFEKYLFPKFLITRKVIKTQKILKKVSIMSNFSSLFSNFKRAIPIFVCDLKKYEK